MSTETITVAIRADGAVEFIYSDEAADAGLLDLGDASIRRVSHVEPSTAGRWGVDLSSVEAGVTLGPFRLRREALDAETKWLRKHRGL